MLAKIDRFELLTKEHHVEKFACGLGALDNFIKKKALDENDSGKSITRVAINTNGNIVGYYTIVCSAIVDMTGGIMVYHPSVELKMFALHNEVRGKLYPEEEYSQFKYSYVMLWKVIEEIIKITKNNIGAEYIILYSVKHAIDLYKENGFDEFSKYMEKNKDEFVDECKPLYMKICD